MSKTKVLKTTHRGIVDFINIATPWLAQNSPDTRAGYAVKRVLERALKIYQRFQEMQEDLNIDHCLADPSSGKILRNAQGGYEFGKDGLKTLNAACRELLDSEVEIEPYFATEPPKKSDTRAAGWTRAEKEAFAGFVIDAPREE